MEPNLVINETRMLPDGRIYFRRRYSDGFGCEGCYRPDADDVPQPGMHMDMARVSASEINRMCCEATSEAERADLESRWDEVWS